MSTRRRLLYALGNPGYQITDRIVVSMLVYFYLPPPGRGLAPQVPEENYLGFLPLFGVAMLVGRVVDTLADPVVGYLSDRSTSPRGRRRSMLIWGIAPMALVPVLLFFPPFGAGSARNAVWLAALLAVYFIAFTAYVGPYFALIPEIAWSQGERLRLSQLMQLASLPLLALLSAWGVGLDLGRRAGLSATDAVQGLVIGLSVLALLLCLGPIFAVNEARHARGTRSELAFLPALRATLRNRAYMTYLLAQVFFVLGINLVQPLFPYIATVALGRSEGFTLWFTAAAGAGIALGFGLQRPLVARFGPKRVMMGCIGVAALAVAALGLLRPDVPGGPHDRANLLLCLGGFFAFGVPAAGLMVLPHVLISQVIDEDERRTGATRAAMFFGVQGLLTKWVYGVSTWCLAFLLLRFGNSPEQPLGVLLVGPVAAVLCLLSLGFYAFYPEARVLAGARSEAPAADPAAR